MGCQPTGLGIAKEAACISLGKVILLQGPVQLIINSFSVVLVRLTTMELLSCAQWIAGGCGFLTLVLKDSCGPTIVSRGAQTPGMVLLEQEEGDDEAPRLAKSQVGSALPPVPAIIRLQNGDRHGMGWSSE